MRGCGARLRGGELRARGARRLQRAVQVGAREVGQREAAAAARGGGGRLRAAVRQRAEEGVGEQAGALLLREGYAAGPAAQQQRQRPCEEGGHAQCDVAQPRQRDAPPARAAVRGRGQVALEELLEPLEPPPPSDGRAHRAHRAEQRAGARGRRVQRAAEHGPQRLRRAARRARRRRAPRRARQPHLPRQRRAAIGRGGAEEARRPEVVGAGGGAACAARRAAGCAMRRAVGGVARRDGGSAHVLAIPCVDVVVGQAVLGRYAVLGRRLRARGGCGGDRRTLTRAAPARLLHPEPIDDRHAVGERPMRLRALRVLAQQVRAHHRGVLVEHRDSGAQEQLHLGAVRSPDHGKHGTLQRRRHRRRIHGRAAALSWLVCGHGRGRRSAFLVCLGVTVPLRLLG